MSACTAIVFPGTLLSSGPDYRELKSSSKQYQFEKEKQNWKAYCNNNSEQKLISLERFWGIHWAKWKPQICMRGAKADGCVEKSYCMQ